MLSSHLILVKEDVGFNYRNFMVSQASEEIAVKKALRKRSERQCMAYVTE